MQKQAMQMPCDIDSSILKGGQINIYIVAQEIVCSVLL